MGQISELLARMETLIEKAKRAAGPTAPEDVRQTIRELGEVVGTAADGTQRKISGLIEAFHADDERRVTDETSRRARHARQRIRAVLAEIVQELCQPLSVISCSISMIAQERIGTVDKTQKSLLDLAAQSADRMKTLIDSLRQISGEPKTLQPDADIQAWLYGDQGPAITPSPAPTASARNRNRHGPGTAGA